MLLLIFFFSINREDHKIFVIFSLGLVLYLRAICMSYVYICVSKDVVGSHTCSSHQS